MPDFDATEGYAEASDRRADARAQEAGACPPEAQPEKPAIAGESEPSALDPIVPQQPIVRRSRHRRRSASARTDGRRVSLPPLHRRRRAARQACVHGRRILVLGGPRRRRRRLPSSCHRRPPGSVN
jgi:hypothetical protein